MSNQDFEIMCKNCGQVVHHECNASLKDELMYLLTLEPDDPPPESVFNSENEYYSEGDEKAPIFTEAFLYTLLGKETARSILYGIHAIVRACGMDRDALYEEALADAEKRRKHGSNKHGRETQRFREAEKVGAGRSVQVRLPNDIIEVLDAAVKNAADTSEIGYSTRSSVLRTLIEEHLLPKKP